MVIKTGKKPRAVQGEQFIIRTLNLAYWLLAVAPISRFSLKFHVFTGNLFFFIKLIILLFI